MNDITRTLYQLARLANKARILGALIHGKATPLLKYLRNRLYFKLLGRFLR